MIRMPYQAKEPLQIPMTFPLPLSRSRDYNGVELLLYTVFLYFYACAKESKNMHNPMRCPTMLLPALAEYYRYAYKDVKDVQMEREIIASTPLLHHEKGTATGVESALSLCKVNQTEDMTIPWFYQRETNTIFVIVGRKTRTYKMLELLRLVVPLGTKIIFKPGHFIHATEEVKMHSWAQVNHGPLDPHKQYYVQPNNYWHTVWDPNAQLYRTYLDEQWALGNPNNVHPQGKDKNGGGRVGGMEVAGNETKPPVSEDGEPGTDSYVE